MNFFAIWLSTAASLLIVRRLPIGLYCSGIFTALMAGLILTIARYIATFMLVKLAPLLNFPLFIVWSFLGWPLFVIGVLCIIPKLLKKFRLDSGIKTAIVTAIAVLFLAYIITVVVQTFLWLLFLWIFALPMLNAAFRQNHEVWYWF